MEQLTLPMGNTVPELLSIARAMQCLASGEIIEIRLDGSLNQEGIEATFTVIENHLGAPLRWRDNLGHRCHSFLVWVHDPSKETL